MIFLGYTKNYFEKDSTNITLNFDLNRIPGSSEKNTDTYLYNENMKNEKFGLYVKPTADINIGSGTTTAPNNISVALPFGIAYDSTPFAQLSFEIGPEIVGDKNFDNYLIYGNTGVYYRWEYKKKVLVNLAAGAGMAHGTRTYLDEKKKANGYSRFTVPLYFKFGFWNGEKNGVPYQKLQLVNSFKFNNVFEDNDLITPEPNMIFNTTRIDLYLNANFAITAQYQYGQEEPLFKKLKTMSFGITLAKF
ncbi:hypothetical protein B0A80_16925 [Flavobacterium tructae]|uniref:hypothetical protein n=1 Tax=Flavobacterium tructae TaxID=1114873 RepID=UPI000B5B818D|nr:hypothetical protein [Flavobacterium tructae]OXB21479.1 hypothetical protein B0A80_16925 [Flavobacterium tructae]